MSLPLQWLSPCIKHKLGVKRGGKKKPVSFSSRSSICDARLRHIHLPFFFFFFSSSSSSLPLSFLPLRSSIPSPSSSIPLLSPFLPCGMRNARFYITRIINRTDVINWPSANSWAAPHLFSLGLSLYPCLVLIL